MAKIIINWEGVSIGSRTLAEYKCQVLNFMNMLYDNIHYSEGKKEFSTGTCMTVSVVSHNLRVEVKRAIAEEYKERYLGTDVEQYIYSPIGAIYANLQHCTAEDAHTKEVRKHCDLIWSDLLKTLTRVLKLKQYIKTN